MAEVEEPRVKSLAERIAALNQAQARDNNGAAAGARAARPPPTSAERPRFDARSRTVNNPPVTSVPDQVNNEPASARSNGVHPPPPVIRTVVRSPPPLPGRSGPPPLPTRRGSETLSPSLPPRRPSSQLVVRRGSGDSAISQNSAVSAVSIPHSVRSSTSAVDTVTARRLPPALEAANLPPLPASRRDSDARAQHEQEAGLLAIPSQTSPAVPQTGWRGSTRTATVPALPTRPSQATPTEDVVAPAIVPRRLPPPASRTTLPPPPRRADFGRSPSPAQPVSNGAAPPPMPRRPMSQAAAERVTEPVSSESAVVELTSANFDDVILRSGKPALVEFYAPYCRYCKELAPVYEELASKFRLSNVTIAQCDASAETRLGGRYEITGYPTLYWFDGLSDSPEKYQWGRDLESLTRLIMEKTGLRPGASTNPISRIPPPIPYASRPPMNKASKPTAVSRATSPGGCLICRDYSRPDQVASQYPRQTPGITVDYLADVLCRHFNSATDKARAIFTWLHHNIDYDTQAFFGGTVKHQTPESTISRGLAVCGGYAGLYAAIALKAGLECVMVTGHGKGIGYARPNNGAHLPARDPSGHAWNAVKIDGGEWKLLDPCWGAGHVDSNSKKYHRKFNASMFTMSNDEFGEKHYPADASKFFRSDGRTLSWEEYILGSNNIGQPVQTYSILGEHGISERSFLPPQNDISIEQTGITRFQFAKLCPHWDHLRNGTGAPYQMILHINGLGGKEEDYVPFDYDGMYWWVDVVTKRLGLPGQQVQAYCVTTINGEDARGITKEEYLAKKGRAGMGFGGIATWSLV